MGNRKERDGIPTIYTKCYIALQAGAHSPPLLANCSDDHSTPTILSCVCRFPEEFPPMGRKVCLARIDDTGQRRIWFTHFLSPLPIVVARHT
jgi:hypothetical protein